MADAPKSWKRKGQHMSECTENPKRAKDGKKRVCVAGGGGFIGSHLAKRLHEEGHEVIAVDWKRCEYFKEEQFCSKFLQLDLRVFENCVKACEGCDWVFNLAADMGGMGFIQSNGSVIIFNNTMITYGVLEAARQCGAARYFYSSSACVYPEHLQEDEKKGCSLAEDICWPAKPQDAYGLEKLYGEEGCINYGRDFAMETRIARFHNIYGGHATWKGGREKAPAAFCRKLAVAEDGAQVQMWGNGEQTRSFCHVDDCVEGILRLMRSDYPLPINLGSDEDISMNGLAHLCASFGNKKITLKHIEGPEGVRGRNSDNTLIKKVLGWSPQISLAVGLKRTYDWIESQIKIDAANGIDVSAYASSTVVKQSTESMEKMGECPGPDDKA